MKAIDEIDSIFLCSSDEPNKLAPLLRRVGPPPEPSMVGVILWRVEVGIHAARRAEFEQPVPMRHRPHGPEKALDNATSFKALGIDHKN